MNSLETIETLVQKIPCPVCLNSRFQVHLRCDLSQSPCDFHAVCGHCRYPFVVTEDTKTMEEIWPRVQAHVGRQGCPQCGDPKLHLEFLCDVTSEDCFFLVRCTDHRHFSRLDQAGLRYLFR
ncbi:MAG: hypothetical protein GWM98_28130 [Nitrospinaceae bacterium]|nr:hypothetical protein [Nitrospinaceae bacterium]NIR57616.1 hypothetical protein [Nitrospinaceae bacterium]NIS88090.1 hypothetical protein [Nitrospinaceae bacterium]NIT84954.1 hypothetical protein [Nitrospinaceae bacterium]NIU47126.1 hypothetical protein [Nitrospinaceae bacterium]